MSRLALRPLTDTAPVPRAPARLPVPVVRAKDGAREAWRTFVSIILSIGWPLTLIAVGAIAGTGLFLSVVSPIASANVPQSYRIGDFADLRADGNGNALLREGWRTPEADGTATQGPRADIVLPIDLTSVTDLGLKLYLKPLFAPHDEAFWVDLLANGEPVTRWEFSRASQSQGSLSVDLPHELVHVQEPLRISLVIGARDPGSAKARGASSGLKLETLQFYH